MKKYLIVITCILMMLLSACGHSADSAQENQSGINVVATVFPEYDWLKNIAGEDSDISLTLLLDSGVDLHSYQPTADDISRISECDMFVYIGGESDNWVEDALKEAKNPDMKVVCVMDTLKDNLKEEETVEGMEAEEEEEAEEGPAYDEHIWLSLKNASKACTCLGDALCEIDPSHSDQYTSNMNSYIEKIDQLDSMYENAASKATEKTLLFGDRFPFRYLTDDYGLQYYAAFSGCSAESEASFETISFLSAKVDELGLDCVMTIDGSDHNIAQTIVSNTKTKDQQILSLDSMQSVTKESIEKGTSYLSVMEDNLAVLKQALGVKED